MKLAPTILLAFAAAALAGPIANPDAEADAVADAEAVAEPEAYALEKRTSCKVARRFRPDYHGVCVDTRQGHFCDNGRLYPGHCPGANYIICCVN